MATSVDEPINLSTRNLVLLTNVLTNSRPTSSIPKSILRIVCTLACEFDQARYSTQWTAPVSAQTDNACSDSGVFATSCTFCKQRLFPQCLLRFQHRMQGVANQRSLAIGQQTFVLDRFGYTRANSARDAFLEPCA